MALMNLREWRSAKDLTQTEAADKLGISQSDVSRIETGKQWPDAETLARIIKNSGDEITAASMLAAHNSVAA